MLRSIRTSLRNLNDDKCASAIASNHDHQNSNNKSTPTPDVSVHGHPSSCASFRSNASSDVRTVDITWAADDVVDVNGDGHDAANDDDYDDDDVDDDDDDGVIVQMDESDENHYNNNNNQTTTTTDVDMYNGDLVDQIEALQEKLVHKQGALEMLLRVKQSHEEKLQAQERTIQELRKETAAQRTQNDQAHDTIAALQEQVAVQAEIITALQPPPPPDAAAVATSSSSSSSSADRKIQHQLAAVKTSLGQLQVEVADQLIFVQQQSTNNRKSKKNKTKKQQQRQPISLVEQMAALVLSIQEREQQQQQQSSSSTGGGATVSSLLYDPAEIQQWKGAMAQFLEQSSDLMALYNPNNTDTTTTHSTPAASTSTTNNNTIMEATVFRTSNQLLQQATTKLQQLQVALTTCQQESFQQQRQQQSLWKIIQQLEQDKQDEIHLLDSVMEHLMMLEDEQEINEMNK